MTTVPVMADKKIKDLYKECLSAKGMLCINRIEKNVAEVGFLIYVVH